MADHDFWWISRRDLPESIPPVTDADLAAWEAAADAATPGPWNADVLYGDQESRDLTAGPVTLLPGGGWRADWLASFDRADCDEHVQETNAANAAFCALARTALPRLVAALRETRAVLSLSPDDAGRAVQRGWWEAHGSDVPPNAWELLREKRREEYRAQGAAVLAAVRARAGAGS